MFASTGDARFRERVNYIIAELETIQRANGNGYVAAIPNGKKIFQEISAGELRVKPFDLNGGWVPWYVLHKLFAGLLDVHQHFNNAKALTIAIKLADWADVTVSKLTEAQFQHMLDCEHGGMNEVLAELYARTGNEKYLRLSRRFHHKIGARAFSAPRRSFAGTTREYANTKTDRTRSSLRIDRRCGGQNRGRVLLAARGPAPLLCQRRPQ